MTTDRGLGAGTMKRAALAVLLLLLGPRGNAQVSDQAQEALANSGKEVWLRFLTPRKEDLPLGPTRIEVVVEGRRAGDRVEIFVDGRKVGEAAQPPWRLDWDAGTTPREHAFTAVLLRGGAEASSVRLKTRSAGVTSSVNRRVVNLFPIVTDRSGHYVWNLARESFTVLEDGKPLPIETFEAIGSPLAVVVVLDVSGSMLPKIGSAKKAARQFLDALKPDDQAGLLTFSSRITGWTGFTTKKDVLKKTIDSLRADGETALYDATAAALMKLRATTGRHALVLFTDGEDNRSRLSVRQVVEMARGSEASIFAVAQVEEKARVLRETLERMTGETGGRAFFITSIDGLPGTFQEILADLGNQYFITYSPPDHPKASWHQIEVKVDRSGLRVRAKTGYRQE